MFTPSGSLAEISHDGTPEAISAIARATTGRDGVRAKLTDHLERFLCFVKAFRRNDKRQQEEGQEAAGGRTGSSRRKDKRQQEEGQEATRCFYAASFPSSCYLLSFVLNHALTHSHIHTFTHLHIHTFTHSRVNV
jgi:hypothetical protein